ncbi:tRNA (adenosine(37)-N6)-threonylcarbamoyltransferase complex dimerization subunit type 1 TsaB [Corallincola spongiicola]|uniref:tRNA threonylcarbamoyladenosine biosynthesis protein TsaB n=1 Tax=Corallincola spongiicola TaxID=2520508 RepID=A0ABY1WVI7_9GAMM|nr:tRNA (adenosine(37)-N6)-threonylcarbamoyltransferase complex dimerization subunit type 1 TsaB [Corallincola spongiicola]TAA48768.1 tRNA (adenosine(37)-N6)-threonylcarbamoyltransferase complex dimerization subunit type 1 TsaB [Corallincola spongiicola]
MTSRKILALDACTEVCSAAILDGDQVIERECFAPREHSQRLLPMVDELLAEAGYGIRDMDAIAFGRGPGSFTGVRICVGFAQGLALGADLPMIGVSTLEAMALQANQQHQVSKVIAAIDARMSEIYVAAYEVEQGNCRPVWSEKVIKPEVLLQRDPLHGHWCGVGSGWQTYGSSLVELAEQVDISERVLFPNAASMARLALPRLVNGELQDCAEVEPIYLRNEVTWQKLPGR